jgi:predicted ATP-grasp superfamily ATP-dependent carboligase
MRALILEDGLSRQALAAGRALAAAGWEVGIGAEGCPGVAACSRSAMFRHQVPAPQLDQDGFVAAIARAVAERGYEIAFGARDVDVLALSERRDEIPALVPYPDHERLAAVFDKAALNAAAERAGVAVPATVSATDGALTAPVMVKARVHATFETGEAPARLDTRLAATEADVTARVEEIEAAGGEVLLQEYLPEPRLVAFVVVADERSRVVASVQQEADAVWPIGAGVSVRAHTVVPNDDLAEGAAALVKELGWTGLAELQYIVPADGKPRLIDFNGRFYGSLALAVGAGANLPAVWAALATSRQLPAARQARPGVRYQWLFGDLCRLMDERRNPVDALRYSRGAVQSVSSLRDPLPALRHFQLALGQYARKLRP